MLDYLVGRVLLVGVVGFRLVFLVLRVALAALALQVALVAPWALALLVVPLLLVFPKPLVHLHLLLGPANLVGQVGLVDMACMVVV